MNYPILNYNQVRKQTQGVVSDRERRVRVCWDFPTKTTLHAI